MEVARAADNPAPMTDTEPTSSDPPAPPAEGAPGRWRLDLVVAALLLLGCAAWFAGVARQAFDYDELEHAHALWLVAGGARPFYDFFECHPPYLWYPLSLVVRLSGESYALLYALRALTALGHLAFLVGLGLNLRLSFQRLSPGPAWSWRAFLIGCAVVAFHRKVVGYLLEFRLDAWPNAALVLAMFFHRRATGRPFLASAAFGLVAGGAILCSPKLVALLGLYVLARLVPAEGRWRTFAGMAAGGAASLVLGVLLLLAADLDPVDVYQLSIGYHHLLNARGGFGHGLAASLVELPVTLGVVVAAVAAWVVVVGRGALAQPFELSVLGFLVAQLALVKFGYKQYYGPWFLLGLAFVPYLEAALRGRGRARVAVAVLAVAFAGVNALQAARRFARRPEAPTQIRQREWMETLVAPDERVLAPLDLRPLFRRDVLYHQVTSFAGNGYDTTKVMRDLAREPFSARFTEASYLAEMEAGRPALIVVEGSWTPEQERALRTYLERHGAAFERVDGPDGAVLVRRREG